VSKLTLAWMLRHAEAAGLSFNPQAKAAVLPPRDTPEQAAPRPDAKQHESLRGLWWIVEFLPKRIKDPAANFAPRWILHLGRPRYVAENAKVHTTVITRQQLVGSYQPSTLPRTFAEIQ